MWVIFDVRSSLMLALQDGETPRDAALRYYAGQNVYVRDKGLHYVVFSQGVGPVGYIQFVHKA